MKSPIDQMLDTVEWTATQCEHVDNKDSLPYATHEGVLSIAGYTLRCYRLSNGTAVFDADDVKGFFGGVIS